MCIRLCRPKLNQSNFLKCTKVEPAIIEISNCNSFNLCYTDDTNLCVKKTFSFAFEANGEHYFQFAYIREMQRDNPPSGQSENWKVNCSPIAVFVHVQTLPQIIIMTLEGSAKLKICKDYSFSFTSATNLRYKKHYYQRKMNSLDSRRKPNQLIIL